MARRLIALVATLCACASSSLRLPKTGPHIGEEPVFVPYPPPPARVQVVPDRPKEEPDAVWVDGQWTWKARRWVWQAGAWQTPLKDGYYAPPTTVMLSDGTIAYFAGAWRKADEKK